MAQQPTNTLDIIEHFGPSLAYSSGTRLDRGVEPDAVVKTHCCFCGQQCGIQLKVKENEIIGFEPWTEFPFNKGMLCPKGVKRYLQGSHPDRLLSAQQRDPNAPGGFRAIGYDDAIRQTADAIARIQSVHGNDAMGMLSGASLTTEKTYLMGKFARVCLKTPYIDYNGRLCMVSAGAGNKKAFGIDRAANPWTDIVGSEVVWISGANVAECGSDHNQLCLASPRAGGQDHCGRSTHHPHRADLRFVLARQAGPGHCTLQRRATAHDRE
ncbi:MAG: molybdopterin-dependent oxidoreductase [Pirellulaceae bacterium]